MDTSNLIIDVVYNEEEILHVLEPNNEGVRGVSVAHFMLRATVQMVRMFLANYDQTKIDDYIDEYIKQIEE